MLDIGKKLKALRQLKNWSQGDVASRLGISVAAYSKIETDVTDVSLSRLIQLSEVFEISLAGLILPSAEVTLEKVDELKKAKETIETQVAKIVSLQEYVIKLYEELGEAKMQMVRHA